MELRFTGWTVIIHGRHITRYTVTIIIVPLAHSVSFKLLFPIWYSCESQVTFYMCLVMAYCYNSEQQMNSTVDGVLQKCDIKRFRRILPTTITGPKNWSYFTSHEDRLFIFAYSAISSIKKKKVIGSERSQLEGTTEMAYWRIQYLPHQ